MRTHPMFAACSCSICWHEKRQSTIQHTSDSKVASISAEVSPESVYGEWEDVVYWKIFPAHLTQQVGLLVRSHEIRNVICIFGSWDVLLSKVHVVGLAHIV